MPKGKGGYKPPRNYVPKNAKGKNSRRDRFEADEREGGFRQRRGERVGDERHRERVGDERRGGRFGNQRRGQRDGAERWDRRDGDRQRNDRFETERGAGRDRSERDDRGHRTDGPRRGAPRRDERGGPRQAPRGHRFDRDERFDDRDGARGSAFDRKRSGERAEYVDRQDRSPREPRGERPEKTKRPPRPVRERAGRPAGEGPRRDRRASAPPRERQRSPRQEQSVDDVVLERFQATTINPEDAQGVSFADLGLGKNITAALADMGAESPFPIQVATIPDVLGGRDVLGRGRTGSGKTIAFGAPLVERLMHLRGDERTAKRKPGRPPRALILAPTRELALQIDRTVQPIARSVGLFTTQIYGGVPQARQVTALKRGIDIVIGTPGRVEDLIAQGHLDLSEVVISVLDEADQMCDLGFLEPVQRILRLTKPGGQRLLFSATLDRAVMQLVDEFLVDPAVHAVAGEDDQHADIDHRVFVVERGDRDPVIAQLASSGGRVLVFTRTRLGAEKLTGILNDAGVPAVAMHGDLNQAKRSRNLQQLTSGRVNVLVATDVAARGIHIDDVRLVLQADMPEEYKTYLHRSGRTGRAGNAGTVITFIAPSRRRKMAALLDRAEVEAPMLPVHPGSPELDEFIDA